MTNWIVSSLVALFSFGLWGLFTKLAVMQIDWKSALVFQSVGVMIIGMIILILLNGKPAWDVKGLGYSLLTGVAYAVGCLFFFIAASKGKIIAVVTLTALYPVITILLAHFFLKETITLKQWLGITLATVSIVLLSSS